MFSYTCLQLWRDVNFGLDETLRIDVTWYNDGLDIDKAIDIRLNQPETVTTKNNLFLSLEQWEIVIKTVAELVSEMRAKAKAVLLVEQQSHTVKEENG